ncbi:MAG: sigma-70 family RNA polymerase sigma factor [Cyclobacteriaceae bacterium]
MESQGILHKICRVYCDDVEQRKDLSQEILIQLWRSYGSFRGDAKFSSWMYRVALNVAIQHLRKAKKRPDDLKLTPEMQEMASSSDSELLDENVKLLHYAIRQLNDIEKAIIMLHLDEKKHEEIAEIIGITQNYVRVKMNRIKEKLRKTLNPQPHGA